MISLQIKNSANIFDEIDLKLAALKELESPSTKTQIAKAVFTITSKQFIKDFSKQAVLNPKKYFHMYEWNGVGNNNKKLFTVKMQSYQYGKLKIDFKFKKSTTPVPIPKALNKLGKKSVSKRSVFYNKADIMENNKTVKFTTKQYIVFLSQKDNKIHFIPPKSLIINNSPGGRQTTSAFNNFVKKWYAKNAESVVVKSRLFDNLGKVVSKSLDGKGKGPTQSKEAIMYITEKYSQGVVEL